MPQLQMKNQQKSARNSTFDEFQIYKNYTSDLRKTALKNILKNRHHLQSERYLEEDTIIKNP